MTFTQFYELVNNDVSSRLMILLLFLLGLMFLLIGIYGMSYDPNTMFYPILTCIGVSSLLNCICIVSVYTIGFCLYKPTRRPVLVNV